ncbi:ERF family protein [Lysobacter sp. HA18]
MTDTKPPLVYAAITAVMADLARTGIGKDGTNVHDNYKFRSIDAMLAALSPTFARHGLVVLPRVITREVTERTSKSGGLLLHTVLRVAFAFIAATDGSRHEIEVIGEATDRADKGANKAMTSAFKHAMTLALCVAYSGVEDADSSTDEAHGARRKPTPQHGACGLAEQLADAIDAASTDAALAALVPTLDQLPVDLRPPLRKRFGDRRQQLRRLEHDRTHHDANAGPTP